MIITSLLDLDLYKLTVGQVIFTHFRKIRAKYRQTVRNGKAIDYWGYVRDYQLDEELKHLETLSLTKDEGERLYNLGYFTKDYIKFLSDAPMRGCYVRTAYQNHDGYSPVPEADGEWCRSMLYEIFCLSIGNELYAQNYAAHKDIPFDAVLTAARARLGKKIAYLQPLMKGNSYNKHPLHITEFGTRRRLSKAWQEEVVKTLWEAGIIEGTSNVYLAMKYGIPVRGTFGHEFPMGMQGLTRIQDSQKEALTLWKDHWKGELAIALDDTLGSEKFIKDFDHELMEYYAGLRHDSGEWKEWTEKRILMYHWAKIQSEKKTLFYSDGLDPYTIVQIRDHVGMRAVPKFGIGTNLTNDTFLPVPQVVMKIVECNGQPVAKISNNPAKACCDDPEYLRYIKHVAGIKDSA